MKTEEEDDNILEKPKEKKPRTQAQKDAFEKGRLIRSENLKIKREKIAEIKREPIKKKVVAALPTPAKQKPAPVPESESEEEEVIVVKRKPKKKKKVIVIEDDSESEEDTPPPPPKLKRQVIETITPIAPTYNIKFV